MCAGIDLANHLLFGNVHVIEYLSLLVASVYAIRLRTWR